MTTKTGRRLQHQGDEQTVIIQSQTKKGLNRQISSARTAAKREGRETIHIRERGIDPDGGYRAIVTSHNFDLGGWVASHFKGKEGREAYQAREEMKRREKASIREEEEYMEEEERKKKWKEEEKRREAEQARAAARQARAEEAQAQAELVREARTKVTEAKAATFKAEHSRLAAAREVAKAAPGRIARGARKVYVGSAKKVAVEVGKVIAERVRGRAEEEEEEEITYTPEGEVKKRVVTRKPRKRMSIFPTMEAARGIGRQEGDGLAYLRQIQIPGGKVSLLGQMVLPGGFGGNGKGLAQPRQLGAPRLSLMGGPTVQEVPTVSTPPGLSEIQGKVYHAVMEDKARSIEDIIQATGLEKGQVSRAVKALEKKGLLKTK